MNFMDVCFHKWYHDISVIAIIVPQAEFPSLWRLPVSLHVASTAACFATTAPWTTTCLTLRRQCHRVPHLEVEHASRDPLDGGRFSGCAPVAPNRRSGPASSRWRMERGKAQRPFPCPLYSSSFLLFFSFPLPFPLSSVSKLPLPVSNSRS